ncbi:MAG: pantetheine-phosphate adenylyltransferase [Clostridium sp.]|nr:pantetheine-phosphate adenylyltransferase [Clostridium sp.]
MTRRYPDPVPAGRVALFAGSFNPFTIGHLSVVERALGIFDRVVVAIGCNFAKTGSGEIDRRRAQVEEAVARFGNRVSVSVYYGLTVDEARRVGAGYLLRGVRSVADFEYERNLADLNRRIGQIETVLIMTLPEHAAISSSAVRELIHYGRDVSDMLP